MMWFIYAVAAAVLWGANYALAEKIGQRVSLISVLALEMIAAAVVTCGFAYCTTLKSDLATIWAHPPLLRLTLAEIVVVVTANIAVMASIQYKNATSASLVDLSYPLFTILFTWLLFHEHHLNTSIVTGGIFIAVGVMIVGFS